MKTRTSITRLTQILFFIILLFSTATNGQFLKSVVYDLDGLDIDQSDLPDGDFSSGDLTYKVAANPLSPADMLGDRVLQLNINWSGGLGVFGRGISRYVELNQGADRLNFFFYNPGFNNQDANLHLIIADDDDQSNHFDYSADDSWQKDLTLSATGGWQFISVPLTDFYDANAGGNGVFDIAFTQNKGMLLMVEFQFEKKDHAAGNPIFYLDMINFSDGYLPRGNSEFGLPYKDPNDYCMLGVYMQEGRGQENLASSQFESLFPSGQGKKIRYVNYFLDWAIDGGTTPNQLPGNEVQAMLADGYRPIITWEPLFQGHTRLDPVQPRLSNIINGDYNSYIDAFANKVKTFNDTVIIRLMHEFEGDWYPWSLSQNNHDPNQYISAYRSIVDRFRALGANNVKWMWCVNSDCAPYASYNWIVPAYPGDGYVDVIASDIYNNHFPVNNPYWKSFRMQCAESYYYIQKYFSQKPFYICEVGCRERFSWENTSSQSKGAWYERMDKEMQSNFHKARALIFFNAAPDQNWTVNSSPYALQSLTDNVWNDPYYFPAFMGIASYVNGENSLQVFPNPTNGSVMLAYSPNNSQNNYTLKLQNAIGETVFSQYVEAMNGNFAARIELGAFPKGIYFVELITDPANAQSSDRSRLIKKLILH